MLTLALVLIQVSVRPESVVPARHERVAVQVANPTDTPIVRVRVAVPDVIVILGADAPPGWTARLVAASDTAAQAVEWTGGALGLREYREFAILGRLPADARREVLVLPVRASFADGSEREWLTEVAIRGNVGLSPGAAFMLAAAALGLAALGVALALRRGARPP